MKPFKSMIFKKNDSTFIKATLWTIDNVLKWNKIVGSNQRVMKANPKFVPPFNFISLFLSYYTHSHLTQSRIIPIKLSITSTFYVDIIIN